MDREEILNKIREEVEEERRNYKGSHCCLTMDAELSRGGTVLYYNSFYREYSVLFSKFSRSLIMSYCICCGKKLPLSLRVKWADTLMEEYKLSDPMNHDKNRIPKEFFTDEWWKKRGL